MNQADLAQSTARSWPDLELLAAGFIAEDDEDIFAPEANFPFLPTGAEVLMEDEFDEPISVLCEPLPAGIITERLNPAQIHVLIGPLKALRAMGHYCGGQTAARFALYEGGLLAWRCGRCCRTCWIDLQTDDVSGSACLHPCDAQDEETMRARRPARRDGGGRDEERGGGKS
jgi:hypothetical protein